VPTALRLLTVPDTGNQPVCGAHLQQIFPWLRRVRWGSPAPSRRIHETAFIKQAVRFRAVRGRFWRRLATASERRSSVGWHCRLQQFGQVGAEYARYHTLFFVQRLATPPTSAGSRTAADYLQTGCLRGCRPSTRTIATALGLDTNFPSHCSTPPLAGPAAMLSPGCTVEGLTSTPCHRRVKRARPGWRVHGGDLGRLSSGRRAENTDADAPFAVHRRERDQFGCMLLYKSGGT